MILSNIKQFLTKNKKVFYYLSFFIVIFSFSGDITFAAEDITAQKLTERGSAILGALGLLLGFATYLATLFLSPEWINGTLFGLDSKFKDVWILVSNVVYFVFAFILIWIAFMNIIGKSGDQYQLKQALPKFIVGVLIVPFSWFLVQFILSISSILTVAALSLPSDTFSEYGVAMEKVIPPDFCRIDLDKFSESTTKAGSTIDGWIDCKNVNTDKNNNIAIDSIFKIIGMYTYGILSFDSMDTMIKDFKGGQETRTLGNLVVQIAFDLLFVVVYSILIITLGIVLLIRGIYIWIYTMISPVFGLMYFFDKKEGGDGFFAKFNLKEFIALAMVPVYTMLALSFGLLFIYVIGEGLVSNGDKVGKDVTVNKKGDTLILGSFSLQITGKIGSGEGIDITGFYKEIKKEGGNVLGVVGTLILKVFGIVVLWGAVMAAMRSSEITKAITQPIHDFGTKVGGIVTSAPGNVPIFGGQSMRSLSSAANTIDTHISGNASTKGADIAGKFINEDPNVRKIQDSVRKLNLTSSKQQKSEAMKDLLNITDFNNEKQVDAFMKAASVIGINELEKSKLYNQNSNIIATHLHEKGNKELDAKFDSTMEFQVIIDNKKGTNTKKGVGDTVKIERSKKDFDNLEKPNKGKLEEIVKDEIKVVLEDESRGGTGSVFINQDGYVFEHTFKIQGSVNDKFNDLLDESKEEVIGLYKILKPKDKGKIDKILSGLGIGDGQGDDFKKAIEDEINKKNKKSNS